MQLRPWQLLSDRKTVDTLKWNCDKTVSECFKTVFKLFCFGFVSPCGHAVLPRRIGRDCVSSVVVRSDQLLPVQTDRWCIRSVQSLETVRSLAASAAQPRPATTRFASEERCQSTSSHARCPPPTRLPPAAPNWRCYASNTCAQQTSSEFVSNMFIFLHQKRQHSMHEAKIK